MKDEEAKGMRLSLENAEALLHDARILAEAGRPHRAIVLAILCIEELGKILLCEKPSFLNREDWLQLRLRHRAKSELLATFLEGTFPHLFRQAKPEGGWQVWAAQTDRLKLQCLYVDFKDGKHTSPLEMPNAGALAEEYLERASTLLQCFRTVVDVLTTAPGEVPESLQGVLTILNSHILPSVRP